MSTIPYRTVEISSDRAQRLIDQGHFNQQLILNTQDTPQGRTFYVGGQIPLRNQGQLSYFRLELGYRAQTFSGQVSWPILFTGWLPCGTGSCESARRIVDEARIETSINDEHISSLPQGVTVTDVRYGDANDDGLTDILVRFSNGAAHLLRQNPRDLLRPQRWRLSPGNRLGVDVPQDDLDNPFNESRAEKQTGPGARPPANNSAGNVQVRVAGIPVNYYYRDSVRLSVQAERAGTLYVRAGVPPRVRRFEVTAGSNHITLAQQGRDLVETADGRIHTIPIEVSTDGQNFRTIETIRVRGRRP